MTPHDYQAFALSTYCAPEHVDRHDYLMHLLFEEVGEVMSLYAKSMRDGHDVDRQTLLLELGDVLWCVACLTDDAWQLSGDHTDHPIHGRDEWPRSPGIDRCAHASNLVDPSYGVDVWDIARFVSSCDPTITLEEVALANVAKLKSRRERGVLKGSGDNR